MQKQSRYYLVHLVLFCLPLGMSLNGCGNTVVSRDSAALNRAFEASFQSKDPQNSDSNISAYVLGTFHKLHLLEGVFSLSDLEQQIQSLNPQLICAEISERHFGTKLAGVYPPEGVAIENFASRIGAKFLPTDWRGDPKEEDAAVAALSKEERIRFNKSHDKVIAAFPKVPSQWFDFVKFEAQAMFREAHDNRIAIGTEVADGFWLARNQMIVNNCMKYAKKEKIERVLFAYGAEHKYIIEDYLSSVHGITALKFEKNYVHSDNPLDALVISKWESQISDLNQMLADPSVDSTIKAWITDSKRIEDISNFVSHYKSKLK